MLWDPLVPMILLLGDWSVFVPKCQQQRASTPRANRKKEVVLRAIDRHAVVQAQDPADAAVFSGSLKKSRKRNLIARY